MNNEKLSDWNSRAVGREERKLGRRMEKSNSTRVRINGYFDQCQNVASHENLTWS